MKTAVANSTICPTHKPIKLGYIAWMHEAAYRAKEGMKQQQCKKCGRWLWKDEL